MADRPFSESWTWVGAYWGAREESVDECADRFVRCLSELAEVHDALASWFYGSEGKDDPGRPVVRDNGPLRGLLLDGRNRNDGDGAVIEDLGYRVIASNANAAGQGVLLSAHVGSYAVTVGNSFVLKMSDAPVDGGGLYEPSVAREIVAVLVDSWDPEFVTWTSMGLHRAQRPGREPVIGWLTYLATPGRRSARAAAEAGGRPVGRGHLFALSERADQVTVEAALQLRQRLSSEDLLTPTL